MTKLLDIPSQKTKREHLLQNKSGFVIRESLTCQGKKSFVTGNGLRPKSSLVPFFVLFEFVLIFSKSDVRY
ncbi:hypothetical protein JTE90_017835 [Oedothorax gibbosus]|uniref:Uncharacterized protein n=1 Tax=Oedothorax gibbosus TaxID=931172 RepID=A0AAV6V8Z0_9ARAC|nr:hypothetical protein JTE90_017835 [Oedothorax gibbosus]